MLAGILFSFLSLQSCSDELPKPDMLTGNTVIVYMGAENSLASYAQSDLDEMKTALGDIPEDCQVVVYRDAELKPAIYHLTTEKFEVWREYGQDHNSADATTMQGVLKTIVDNFPSEKYSLVLWSHGTGWSDTRTAPQRSIIVDNERNSPSSNIGQWVHISQLASVLKTLPHMEYIFFDACYMQSVELASHLYPLADYLIGSPTEIPARGAPYDRIMHALCVADIQGIIDGYASSYTGTGGVLLSAVHSAEFNNFCTVTAQYIPTAFPRSGMPQVDKIQIYAPAYGTGNTMQQGSMPVPYDIRSALYHVLSSIDYNTWEQQWRKTILYPVKASYWDTVYPSYTYGSNHNKLTDPDHYGGISMNIPQEDYKAKNWDTQFQASPWYTSTLWEQTGW